MSEFIVQVTDSPGLLEEILSYCSVPSLLYASLASRRWKEAARSDCHWRCACARLWEGKHTGTTPSLSSYKHGPASKTNIFPRTLFSPLGVERLPEEQARSLLSRLSTRWRTGQGDDGQLCLEQMDQAHIRRELKRIMNDMIAEFSREFDEEDKDDGSSNALLGFDDIWFGCYVSSLIDSRRVRIGEEELCSESGFNLHFKFSTDYLPVDAFDDEEDMAGRLEPYGDRTDVMLMFHTACRFDRSENGNDKNSNTFHLESDPHHPAALPWRWLVNGRALQVLPYPPLVVSRTSNWGWKLENMNVVLTLRGGS